MNFIGQTLKGRGRSVMKAEKLNDVEKAFVSYRSLRLKKKWYTLSKKELLILNEPLDDDGEEGSEAKADKTSNRSNLSLEEQVSNELDVKKAMEYLTEKESLVIVKLFWEQKSVKEVCWDLDISKNAVLKISLRISNCTKG